MNPFEIIAAVATTLGVCTFSAIFTILYRGYTKATVKEVKVGKRDIALMDDYVYGCIPSVKVRRIIWKVVKSILFYGILLLMIPVFAFSIMNKIQGNVMMFGEHTVMVVASGSMSERNKENDYIREEKLDNQFNTYDLIVLEKVDEAEELEQYDVIAFVNDKGTVVIHRIIAINPDGTYETRGDSNNKSDSYNPKFDDVIGRYNDTNIRFVGAFVMFFQSISGIVTLLALFYCLLMLDRFNARIQEVESDRLEQLLDSIALDLNAKKSGVQAEFCETLYYKGYAYYFNEKGFIGKDEITDASYLEKSNSAAIRVVDADGERHETEVQIHSEEGDDTP
ncbi:MAG: signal peptidase I [Clostridia bacterium]|nr:signal peptidase I [Clostridia bacterium]